MSKRIRVFEDTPHTRLLHRATRSISLTEADEKPQRWAIRILDDLDHFVG